MILDINDFKQINDLCGHDIGDFVLQLIGNSLKATLRAEDLVYRLGGDEFAVLLPHLDGPDTVPIERVMHCLTQIGRMPIEGLPLGKLTVSAGVACHTPEHPLNAVELYRHADQHMYARKRQARRDREQ